MILRLLDLNSKPIIDELKHLPILKYELGSRILMGELEYLFSQHRNGFCVSDELFRHELGFSLEDFLEGFEKIGVSYDSREEFQAQSSKFKGKFYCSFYDVKFDKTCYRRNHSLVEKAIKSILGEVTIADIYKAFLEQEKAQKKEIMQKLEAGELVDVANVIF